MKISKPLFMFIDIDGFKQFNNFYGSRLGDNILRHSAQLLKNSIPHIHKAKLYRLER